jgi:aldehyde dehydrogenase (NAD+)
MLVHRSHYDEAVELAAKTAAGYTVGDPFDEGTRLGPLVSGAQRERVRGFIERADARLVAGGLDAPVPGQGHFVAPTVFADVDPASELAQEEIFGPVLSIIPFGDDDEAVQIANNSRTGWPAASGAVRSARSRWPGGCAPARSTSTAEPSTVRPVGGIQAVRHRT